VPLDLLMQGGCGRVRVHTEFRCQCLDACLVLNKGRWRPESGVKGDWRGSGFMVMLGDGTDILGGAAGLAGWP